MSALAAFVVVAVLYHPYTANAAGGVTIYNDIYNHWHVFAGVIATVRKHVEPRPELLWMAERSKNVKDHRIPPFGLREWLGDVGDAATLKDWRHLELVKASPTGRATDISARMKTALDWGPVDALICVSPELDRYKTCAYAAKYLKAKSVIAVIHRGDEIGPKSWFLGMKNDKEEIPVHLLGLVPHVMTSANETLKGRHESIQWGLMVAPYTSPQPCKKKSCLSGFVVQGALRRRQDGDWTKFIRDYDSLWKQMMKKGAPAVRMKIMGKGMRSELGVPKKINSSVDFYSGLPFPEYWDLIDKSYALVPFHGTPQYYTMRCSSTVLASLITCVPLIADDTLLAAYYMFKKEHVFYQAPGETEMDVMERVMALPEKELFAKRAAVCRLRDEQLKRTAGVIEELIASTRRRAA
ncbi:hypothetical protein HYH03_011365 [Edaphochlamys debaryana]|uniref:Glycosyltransferase n=1 Tax=Edaphochlamys debaryana TaxID=47281 RepID=A0A836BV42_9CHLO|nr:hypothetical protein HYH03_011365 [Edaphochlamys debaryana]|eukprot:KAG2490241.1 hypothetical protein HYH03_011365 [Edaphochlamys debaryana]